MKFLTKILAFTFLLTFGSIILVSQGASANELDGDNVELQSANSIRAATHIDKPIRDFDRGLVSFPDKIWHTRGEYRGYLYVRNFEELSNGMLRANYVGTLYKYVSPVKTDPELE
ncbi:hypothetical protein [Oceanobacillus sp. 1P07AA]|uniref:hypothetical protein n=1 Tax=Oceanobacillus sp. 1P07AA TaxID=3132293 RepID=UPI0039A446E9